MWTVLLLLFGVAMLAPLQATEAQPLNLEVTVSDDPVQPGQQFFYRATVSNTGTEPLSSVVLQAQLPSQTSNFSEDYLTEGGTCEGYVCRSNGFATWNFASLGVGESRTVEIPMRTVLSVTANQVVAVFQAGDAGNPNDEQTSIAIALEEISTPAILDVAIDATPGPVGPGETLTYTISFGNRGIGQVSGVVLSALLPAGVDVLASDGGTIDGDTIEWDLGTIGGGRGGQREVTVTVPPLPNGEILVAEAQIRDSLDLQPESRATAAVTVHDDDALQLVVTVSDDPVQPGQHVFYRATMSNTGTAPLNDIELQVRVPYAIRNFPEESLTGGGTCRRGMCIAKERISWRFSSLGVGESRTVEVPAEISTTSAFPSGSLSTMRFFADYPGGPALLVASETVLIDDNPGPAVLDVAIDAAPAPVPPGAALTYTLSFANRGIGQVSGAVLTALLPAGVSVLAADGGTIDGNTIEWNLGTIGGGRGGQREVTVTVPTLPNGEILVAEAQIRDSLDLQPESQASRTVIVHDDDALQLVVTVSDDPVQPEQHILYRATISNTGAAPLSNVGLQMRIPDEVYGASGSFRVWSFSSLGVGQSRTVEVPVQIVSTDLTPPGSLSTTRFFADYPGNPAPLLALNTVLIDNNPGPAVLDVAINAGPEPVDPGETLTYTISFGNRGFGQASGTVLSALLPAGVDVLSTDGGTINGNAVEWTLGTLGAGRGGRREVAVTVPTLPNGEILVTEARIRDGLDLQPESRVRKAVVIHDDDALQIAVTVNGDPVEPRQRALYQATISNTGTMPLSNVLLQARTFGATPYFDDGFATEGGTFVERTLMSWNFSNLGVGQSRTVEVPVWIGGPTDAPPGSLNTVRFFANSPGGPTPRVASETVLIVDHELDPVTLDVAIDVAPGPIGPDEALTYTISFGNRGSASASDVILTALLPTGPVTWALGNLEAGEVGQCEFTVTPQSLTDGQILTAEALIRDDVEDRPEFRASIATQVRGDVPVDLVLSAPSTVILPDNQTVVRATVVNGSSIPLSNVGLQARVPTGISEFSQLLLTEGGTCYLGRCSSFELANWNFPFIGVGQQSPAVEMPLSIPHSIPPGTLIKTSFLGRFSLDAFQQLLESKTVLVGNSFGACPPAQTIPEGLIFRNGFEG